MRSDDISSEPMRRKAPAKDGGLLEDDLIPDALLLRGYLVFPNLVSNSHKIQFQLLRYVFPAHICQSNQSDMHVSLA